MKNTRKISVEYSFRRSDRIITLELPAKPMVCYRCDGSGTHVNPNIDGHGISPEEFTEDPDFAESYFSGVFDVQCDTCKGEKILQVVDEVLLTKRQKILWAAIQDRETEDRRERAEEARWMW